MDDLVVPLFQETSKLPNSTKLLPLFESRILFPFYLWRGLLYREKRWATPVFGVKTMVSGEEFPKKLIHDTVYHVVAGMHVFPISWGREGATNWVSPHDGHVGSTIVNSVWESDWKIHDFSCDDFPIDLPTGISWLDMISGGYSWGMQWIAWHP